MHTPSAHSGARSPGLDDAVRDAVLEAATAPLAQVFGDRVRVTVERLNRDGDWVFLQSTMRGADGGRPDFAGTSYEAARNDGAVSDVYVALLKKAGHGGVEDDARSWRLTDYATGPTDVAWLTWPDAHEAPHALFGF
ncbi:hypothetical protein CFN78_00155 [Amycolatopsis antarctica]|uniref:Uncharacterized protein n=1 Tax=Amycolatopsis antarctica TaxID=1854586 RepID=A0A263D888_9PSEU|nr:hypothetical protein [Amycolatopsis antarctica]OZM74700.1 hypothetical protein CFN78_00155 [Amycolatopsis antarctica]